MAQKERKTAKELEHLALEIVRRIQGCGHVEAVTVSSDPHKGVVHQRKQAGTRKRQRCAASDFDRRGGPWRSLRPRLGRGQYRITARSG